VSKVLLVVFFHTQSQLEHLSTYPGQA